MVQPGRCLLILVALLSGCSSSSIFSRRDLNESPGADEPAVAKMESKRSADAGKGARSERLPRAAGKRGPEKLTPAQLQQRRQIAEALAAGVRYEQQGDTAAAQTAYERVLKLDPQHAFAHYQLAIAADNTGRFDEADRHYQVLLSQTPHDPNLLASVGWSYLLRGQNAESERVLREALEIDPQHPTALYNLGWLYGTQGKYDEAQAILRSAGSEADAQKTLAELFPEGRPAPSRASGSAPASLQAPAPGSTSRSAAGMASRASDPRSAVQGRSQARTNQFEERFAQLESRAQGGRIRDPEIRTVAASSDDSPAEPPEIVGAGAPGLPLIRPGSSRTRGAGPAHDDEPPLPRGRTNSPAVPERAALPEWPHRSAAAPAARAAVSGSETAAAQWGLSAGPGGLLLPPANADSTPR